jgi:leucyl/phenylalanyl-tRNA--protein transferase
MVLEVGHFKLHRSLRKTLRKFRASPECEIRVNSAFDQVIVACATSPRKGHPGTWIVPDMVAAYTRLHQVGHAHSVETWVKRELVGGLYCVSVGRAVFGESMFSHQPDASKIALAALVALCSTMEIAMVDCQQNTPHLASLGAKEMPRTEFLQRTRSAITQPTESWTFRPLYWDAILGS